jgi:methylenetetrahydrofolate/methylenetetrahydromethanopterin dehydrogenase (NADP+)
MAAEKSKILIQLDVDPQPSVFDGVVAVDSGVDHLFRHGGVTPAAVRDLVHGALFTRGPAELCSTAIFVGGSDVTAAEAVLDAVKKTFFGPFKVSVLFDANGANTTAAAAVLAALEIMDGSLEGVPAVVLAATGPVGQRAARLLSKPNLSGK